MDSYTNETQGAFSLDVYINDQNVMDTLSVKVFNWQCNFKWTLSEILSNGNNSLSEVLYMDYYCTLMHMHKSNTVLSKENKLKKHL